MDHTITVDCLPREIVEKILGLLPFQALLPALRVCRLWREVGETPRLWTRLRLSVKTDTLREMPETLAIPRLRALRGLRVRAVSDQLFRGILEHPGLRELDLRCTDLSGLDPELLAVIIPRMERVIMFSTQLTRIQTEKLFAALCGQSRLKILNISDNLLSGVPPAFLCGAAISLEKLEAHSTGLTPGQVTALMAAIGERVRDKRPVRPGR